MSNGLILDDYAMLILEHIMEMREDTNIKARGLHQEGTGSILRLALPILEVRAVEELGLALINHIMLLCFMSDVPPHRRGCWHVKLSVNDLEYIGRLHLNSGTGHFHLIRETALSYGYEPAKIVEKYYWVQKPVTHWTR